MKKTKIVCTLGPASKDIHILENMLKSGMNVARLNMSHGTLDWHREMIEKVRAASKNVDIPVAIMVDLKGPEIRTGKLKKESVELKTGETLKLTTENVLGDEHVLSISYTNLPSEVKSGDKILLNDGAVGLEVISTTSNAIETKVKFGGVITNERGVNVPGVSLGLPAISDIDKNAVELAVEENVDFIAMSFVRSPSDVSELKGYIKQLGGDIDIIAKIETQKGLENLGEILKISEGVMVARGDLGVEIALEKVPTAQKYIIQRANALSKPVITATQMLESMIENPRPTRAEVTDIANAIFDGTDAVMLSGETAKGKYPVECVETMSIISLEAEEHLAALGVQTTPYLSNSIEDVISSACVNVAEDLGANAIITSTKSGSTARRVSRYRPKVSIIATTSSEKTFRRLLVVWGVEPIKVERVTSTDEVISTSIKIARRKGYIKEGDTVVITAGIPIDTIGTTNMIKVSKI
ncbi:MAG: pyruvate kinase [Thermotogae bacterium]|nr:pyruvate kinase [Thermotogota bacterium]